ncbi:MAG TPA: FKBP-type peptidyl-prolyl cis-trans isomerase [Verrucomicrobiae bacterium]|jgi:FKBP-type peptidyl-prolyl cis-trans isomerase SlyD|nr:FKBP-type peptidyl-prolyl cis-trans isomerase [Verrucomicrobiae bacterium]
MEAKNEVIQEGKSVRLHYTVTSEGKIIESTRGKPPFYYVQGNPRVLPALQRKVEGKREGETLEFTLAPEEAYGLLKPEALVELPMSEMPQGRELKVGMVLQEEQPDGSLKVGRIHEIKKDSVIMNFNHPMAGKTLTYRVEVVSVTSQSASGGPFPFMEDFPDDKEKD